MKALQVYILEKVKDLPDYQDYLSSLSDDDEWFSYFRL